MIFLGTPTIRKIEQKCRYKKLIINVLPGNFVRFFTLNKPCFWKVLFFGNDSFSLESLKTLKGQQDSKIISRLELVTSAARNNPVMQYALENKIPSHTWPYDSRNIEDFDIGVVASFGYLIPKNIISKFPLGMINVHASLLPRWRGASPIAYAILHSDSKTGISIMKIRPHRFDVGEVISQAELNIAEDETFQTLLQKLSRLGANELAKSIKNLPHNLETAKPQDNFGVTHAPKITKELAVLNFAAMDATAIYTLERAISHLFPLTTNWCEIPVKLLEVHPSKCSTSTETPQPGRVYYNKKTKKINVECCGRTFITFSKVVISKQTMSSSDFYNGYLSKVREELRFFR